MLYKSPLMKLDFCVDRYSDFYRWDIKDKTTFNLAMSTFLVPWLFFFVSLEEYGFVSHIVGMVLFFLSSAIYVTGFTYKGDNKKFRAVMQVNVINYFMDIVGFSLVMIPFFVATDVPLDQDARFIMACCYLLNVQVRWVGCLLLMPMLVYVFHYYM